MAQRYSIPLTKKKYFCDKKHTQTHFWNGIWMRNTFKNRNLNR